jgi:hypothetical protein
MAKDVFHNNHLNYLLQALQLLGWTHQDQADLLEIVNAAEKMAPRCLLSFLNFSAAKRKNLLSSGGRKNIGRLVEQGIQLYCTWPNRPATVERWLGQRFYLVAKNLALHELSYCNSIACSRLGRNHQELPEWPRLLEWAMQVTARDHRALMCVAGTTLDSPARIYAQTAGVPILEMVIPESSGSTKNLNPEQWLAEQLQELLSSSTDESVKKVCLSPPLDGNCETTFQAAPVQDRVCIALAEKILVLFAREGGTIAQLLNVRLEDCEFATASVYCALTHAASRAEPFAEQRETTKSAVTIHSAAALASPHDNSHWLDRGAVGYLIEVENTQVPPDFARCCQSQLGAVSTMHICYSLKHWHESRPAVAAWMVHCTRGNIGPLPQESALGYTYRIWNQGQSAFADPLHTLIQILHSGRLKGSSRLTRGTEPMVSFSQLALPDLLSQRRYRPHLGRWDWEPYGLLIDRRELRQIRPVIYGSKADYSRLPSHDRAYFQPLDAKNDWQWEQEWRMAGDVDLKQLPPHAAIVFVKSRHEARQVACHSPFPVIWTNE